MVAFSYFDKKEAFQVMSYEELHWDEVFQTHWVRVSHASLCLHALKFYNFSDAKWVA